MALKEARVDYVTVEAGDFGTNLMGAIVFWSLDSNLQLEVFNASLKANGAQSEPPTPAKPAVLLRRTVEHVARNVAQGDVHVRARAEYAITTHAKFSDAHAPGDKQKIEYEVLTQAKVTGANLEVTGAHVDAVREVYARLEGEMAPHDLGSWLVGVVDKLSGIPIRPSGGVYFLPQESLAEWNRINTTLESLDSKSRLYAIPSLRTADAVDAILAAVATHVDSVCQRIEEEIPQVGAKALNTRRTEVEDMARKVKKYEGILGKQLVAIRENLATVERATAAAILAVEGGDVVSA